MMGMSSPEWSRYMHDVIGLEEPPDEINAEVVRRLEAVYRENLPLILERSLRWRGSPSAGRSGWHRRPTAA